MSERQFKEGDVVMLKSGGPRMTVDGYDDLGMVICTWFEGKKRNQTSFTEGTLAKAPPLSSSYAAG